MTQVYLKRIVLQQFRSFAALDIELPAEPSVLIVHGSNGLGKSSLFGALEWALSDRIDHFRDAKGVDRPGAYLCRWREGEPGVTSTTLEFSDGSTLKRSLLSRSSTESDLSGNVPDISAFLIRPDWKKPISEIQRYLLLTHFLGQSTMSRFTHRESTERFDILKEAAQSAVIEAISNSLHGQGNNTVVRAYARQIEALERDAKSLGDLLVQEAALWAEAKLSGAVDDALAGSEARRIADLLSSTEVGDQVAFRLSEGGIDSMIRELQTAADLLDRECLAAEGQLEDARRLLGDQQRAIADKAQVVALREATQARLEALSGELEQGRMRQGVRRGEVAKWRQAATDASTSVLRLRKVRDARVRVARLTIEHRDSDVARTIAQEAKLLAERDLSLAERRRQIFQQVQEDVRQCDEEIERLREEAATVEQAIAGGRRIRDQANALGLLEATHPNIEMLVARAEDEAAAAIERVNVQATIVEEFRVTVDGMSKAIAAIAVHLPGDECVCPVCATCFDSASTLQARVSTAVQRLAPTLVAQERLLSSLSAARDDRASVLQEVRAAHSAILSARAVLDAERELMGRLLARQNGGSPEDLGTLAEKRAIMADAIARESARRLRKVRWQTHPALGGQGNSVEYTRATWALDATQRALDAATRKSNDLAAALECAKADEADANSAMGMVGGSRSDDFPSTLQEAEASCRRVEEEEATANRALINADIAVGSLEDEEAGLRARLLEIDSRKADLDQAQRKIWSDWIALLRFGPAPESAPIQAVERRITASRLAIKEAKERLARLRDGHLAWSRQLSHSAVLEQIREQVDVPEGAAREEVLAIASSLQAQLKSEADAVRKVKEIARAASADISKELEGFNSEFIKPLEGLMSRINQAILCDPRIGIGLQVKKKKIEQSAVKVGEVPKDIGAIDPILVHSEGQMAALAVSMLCAANLTFPWSRWKALILDDPLQHNDAIHVSAFADLMGNLVTHEGYQILLSTHDAAQAEFLKRKVLSRMIPCTVLSLLGVGKDGVEWSVQSAPPLLPAVQTQG